MNFFSQVALVFPLSLGVGTGKSANGFKPFSPMIFYRSEPWDTRLKSSSAHQLSYEPSVSIQLRVNNYINIQNFLDLSKTPPVLA